MLNGFDNAPLEVISDGMILTPQDKSNYYLEKNQSGFSYLGVEEKHPTLETEKGKGNITRLWNLWEKLKEGRSEQQF